MEQAAPAITIIQKENIPQLKFPAQPVFLSKAETSTLNAALSRAIILGNTQKHKVKIYFLDSECLRMTETTIWAVTDKSVVLKKGVSIPIHRIYEISDC